MELKVKHEDWFSPKPVSKIKYFRHRFRWCSYMPFWPRLKRAFAEAFMWSKYDKGRRSKYNDGTK